VALLSSDAIVRRSLRKHAFGGIALGRRGPAKRDGDVRSRALDANHLAPIRTSAIKIRVASVLSARIREKKFSTLEIVPTPSFALARRQKILPRDAHHVCNRAQCDNEKTLEPCVFLHHANKRVAFAKSSRVEIARAMNCIAAVRATRGGHRAVAHFLLTGFGVSRLVLYKLQRDAGRIAICIGHRQLT
jgi:hypothetical protein